MNKVLSSQPLLIYASPEHHPDLQYAIQALAPDPCLWVAVRGEATLIVSPLEVSRLRAIVPNHAPFPTRVLSTEESKTIFGHRSNHPHMIIHAITQSWKVARWVVPYDFPTGLAYRLKRMRIPIIPVKERLFFRQRLYKTDQEISWIIQSQRMAESGFQIAHEILKEATISSQDRTLWWKGTLLTSEYLREQIDNTIWNMGGLPLHTIVACGQQAADPHEKGSGPLFAHQPIVIDIFPRHRETGYFGDLTRTVVKGSPSPLLLQAYHAVREARDYAIAQVRPGMNGREIHQAVNQILEKHGFKTQLDLPQPVGFIHGTGHGLGLEIHEPPRISTVDAILEPGMVHSVEPGLYDPSWGGVRLEDIVVVTQNGCHNLTQAPDVFEII